MKKINLAIIACVFTGNTFAQAFDQSTIAGSANIGAPHLYKGIVKLATQSEKFKQAFSGKIVVGNIKGVWPMAFKAEWGINKYFGIGISSSRWDMSFDVTDYYNVLHAGQVTGTDEIDTYKFKLTSTSFGIRPNLHIPLQNSQHDIYVGMGIGYTNNKLLIDFSSTDVNKVFPNAAYNLNLPGFIYLAPSLGYRYYFSEYLGTNIELGYEKGAIIQGGVAIRFNHKND